MKGVCLTILTTLAGLTLNGCVSHNPYKATLPTASNNTAVYPVAAVLEKVKTDYAYRMVLKDYNAVQISAVIKPAGAAQFNGKTVLKAVEDSTFEVGAFECGAAAMGATDPKMDIVRAFKTDIFYTTNPFLYYGFKRQAGDIAEVVEQHPMPDTAKVGDLGVYAIEDRYFKEARYHQYLSYQYAWALTQATPDTAWLCDSVQSIALAAAEAKLRHSSDESNTTCYQIDKAGTILDAKMVIPPTKEEAGFTWLLKQ